MAYDQKTKMDLMLSLDGIQFAGNYEITFLNINWGNTPYILFFKLLFNWARKLRKKEIFLAHTIILFKFVLLNMSRYLYKMKSLKLKLLKLERRYRTS